MIGRHMRKHLESIGRLAPQKRSLAANPPSTATYESAKALACIARVEGPLIEAPPGCTAIVLELRFDSLRTCADYFKTEPSTVQVNIEGLEQFDWNKNKVTFRWSH